MQTLGEPENIDEVLNDLVSQLQRLQMPAGEPLELSWDTIGDTSVTPKSICFVVSSFEGIYINSGIGTAYYGLAELLARNGHNVTVLYTRDSPASTGSFNDWVERYQEDNINLKFLPQSQRVTNPKLQTTSYLVYNYLKTNSFDTVHFADFEGLGYYTIRAKRDGQAFAQTALIVGLHGPTSWILQANTGRDPAHESELEVDYMERYSVENADNVWTPSNYLASWLSLRGWNISNIELLPLPPGPGINPSTNTEAIKAREIVFFGRLEKRKGLILFCDAIDILSKMSSILPSDFSVSFLGSRGFVDGMDSVQYVKSRSSAWPFPAKVITEFTRDAAMAYLTEEGTARLPVIPSLVDNAPYTVFECLYANIPFLASATPSIIPLLSSASTQSVQLFETKPHHLASRMINALKTGVAPATPVFTADRAEQAWMSFYNRIPVVEVAPVISENPLVSVCITYFNRPALVRQALQSIESQDYQNLEVILVDDGSNDTSAVRYLESIESYFAQKNWKIIRTANRYLGAARNTAAQSAQGKYLLFLDDDNVAYTHQLSTYVSVAEKTHANIVTAGHSIFRGTNPPSEDKVEKLWLPLGDSLAVGLFKNCFGDANFFVEKEAFLALGGFTEEYGVGLEEHEFFAKAIFAGYKLTIVPEPLMYYRMHDEANQMLFTTDIRQGEARRMRPYLQALTPTEQTETDESSTRARRSVVALVARNAVRGNTDCNATVTSISPAQGPIVGGTFVTITGSGFNCLVQAVKIDGLDCTGVHVVDDNQLTCTTPQGNRSYVAVDLAVTVAGNPVVMYSAWTWLPAGAPQLQRCIVNDDGLAFDCVFSVPTNKESCASLLSTSTTSTLGEGWSCVWVNTTTFEVTFGTGATLNIADPVTVLAATVTSIGSGGIQNEETVVALTAPFHPVKPVAAISVPSQVPSCEAAALTGSATGSAGRNLVSVWSLVSESPANANSAVTGLLSAATSLQVSLSSADLSLGSTYVVALRVTNWLAQSADASATFTKNTEAVPLVSIAGAAVVQIKASQALSLVGTATPTCGAASLEDVNYLWVLTPAVSADASLFLSSTLSLPAGTLTAGTTYVATLQVSTAAAPSVHNDANVTVVVGVSDLIAQIAGGNQQYAQTETVTLDAATSSDPDNLGALSFSWTCSKFNEPETPCPSISLPSIATLAMTGADIGVGKWTFTVTVSGALGRTASASAWVEVTEAVVITVAIDAVQSPVNPGAALTITGKLVSTTVAASDIAWSWTLVSGSITNPAAYPAGTTSPSLVIAANSLAAASQYEYKLTATHTSGATGYASATFTVAQAPSLSFSCGAINGAPEDTLFVYDLTSTSGVNYLLSFTPSGETVQVPLTELSTVSSFTTALPAGTYSLIGSTFSSAGVATSKACDVSLSFADQAAAITNLISKASGSVTVFDLGHIAFSAKTAFNAATTKPNLETLFAEILSGLQQTSSSASAQGVVAATFALYVVADNKLSQHTEADLSSVMTLFSELLDKQVGTTDVTLVQLDIKLISEIYAQIGGVNTNSKKRAVQAVDTTALYAQAAALAAKVGNLAGSMLANGQTALELSSDNVEITIFKQLASIADTGVAVGPNSKFTFPSGFVPSTVSPSNSLLFVFSRYAKSSFEAPSGYTFSSPLITMAVSNAGSPVSFTTFDPAVEIVVPSSKLSSTVNPKCFVYTNNTWTDAGATTSADKSGVTCSYTQSGAAYAVLSDGAAGAKSPGKSGSSFPAWAGGVIGGVAGVAIIAALAGVAIKRHRRQPRPAAQAAVVDPAAPAPGSADATAIPVDAAAIDTAAAAAAAGSLPSGLSSYSSRSYSSSYATSSSSSEEEMMEAEIKNIVGELTQALPKDARALEVLGDKLEME